MCTLPLCFCILILVYDTFDEAEVPEIWETEEEKSLSIGQLKYRYLQVAREQFQGNIYTNKSTQKPIRVSKDGIMEWWKKSRKREHIISVQCLDWFLENAVFIGEKADYLGRNKIISASQFKGRCKINGRLLGVIITTRKAIYDIDKFRYLALDAAG